MDIQGIWVASIGTKNVTPRVTIRLITTALNLSWPVKQDNAYYIRSSYIKKELEWLKIEKEIDKTSLQHTY